MPDKKSLVWLDFLRGIAAIAVAAGHVRALTLHDFDAEIIGSMGKIFYFSTGLGHQAVIVFFVLSGFLISRSIEKKRQEASWQPVSYASDRVVRLCTVLWPALVLTWCCDRLGMGLFSNALAYTGSITTLPSLSPAEHTTVAAFWGNMIFLQQIVVPVFGSNTPLWSLSYEFWYYAIYPLLFFSVFGISKIPTRLLLLGLAALIFWMVGHEAQAYFPIWLMGAGAFFIANRQGMVLKYPVMVALAVAFLLIVLAATRANVYPAVFNDFSLGIATAVVVTVSSKLTMPYALLRAFANFLSKISYSVYLAHMPLAVLICSWLAPERHAWGAQGGAVYCIAFVSVLAGCYLMWYLFEKKTPQVKRAISSFL